MSDHKDLDLACVAVREMLKGRRDLRSVEVLVRLDGRVSLRGLSVDGFVRWQVHADVLPGGVLLPSAALSAALAEGGS